MQQKRGFRTWKTIWTAYLQQFSKRCGKWRKRLSGNHDGWGKDEGQLRRLCRRNKGNETRNERNKKTE